MSKTAIKLRGIDKTIKVDAESFGKKLAKAMKEIGSSNVFFIMQQAYGEIAWEDCEEIWKAIITPKPSPINSKL